MRTGINQCSSCGKTFDEPEKGYCPHCGSGNWVSGYINKPEPVIKEVEFTAYYKVRQHFELQDLKLIFREMVENEQVPDGVEEEKINWEKLHDNYYQGEEFNETKRSTMAFAIESYIRDNFPDKAIE